MVLLPTVTLTDDEQRECEAHLRSVFPQTEEGAWYMPAEVADVVERGLVAVCMMGRAQRFAILGQFAEACAAASKACSIDPQSLRFYEFAHILEKAGKHAEARAFFSEFLRRYDIEQQNATPDHAAKMPSIVAPMVSYARSKTGG